MHYSGAMYVELSTPFDYLLSRVWFIRAVEFLPKNIVIPVNLIFTPDVDTAPTLLTSEIVEYRVLLLKTQLSIISVKMVPT